MHAAILIVEDEASLVRNIVRFLEREGFTARAVGSAEEALDLIPTYTPDLVLTDLRLPGMSGIELLEHLKSAQPELPVALMTAYGDVRSAVDALKKGAVDYLSKPLVLRDVGRLAERILHEQKLSRRLAYFERRQPGQGGIDAIIGESEAVLELKRRIRKLVEHEAYLVGGPPAAVLITGETGAPARSWWRAPSTLRVRGAISPLSSSTARPCRRT